MAKLKKTCKPVLIVIDMQPEFISDHHRRSIAPELKKLFKNIRKEVEAAIKQDSEVIFLEYIDSGMTYEYLIVDMFKVNFLTKTKNDGSEVVYDYLKHKNIQPTEFRIAGINRSACVGGTASGLCLDFPDTPIYMLEEAIDDMWGAQDWGGIDLMKKHQVPCDNIKFIPSTFAESLQAAV